MRIKIIADNAAPELHMAKVRQWVLDCMATLAKAGGPAVSRIQFTLARTSDQSIVCMKSQESVCFLVVGPIRSPIAQLCQVAPRERSVHLFSPHPDDPVWTNQIMDNLAHYLRGAMGF